MKDPQANKMCPWFEWEQFACENNVYSCSTLFKKCTTIVLRVRLYITYTSWVRIYISRVQIQAIFFFLLFRSNESEAVCWLRLTCIRGYGTKPLFWSSFIFLMFYFCCDLVCSSVAATEIWYWCDKQLTSKSFFFFLSKFEEYLHTLIQICILIFNSKWFIA